MKTFLALVAGLVMSLAASVAAAEQSPFAVGTASANRGQKATGILAVPPGVDAGLDIPVAVMQGARPGPVLAIVAGAHGTEYASIIAIEKLIGTLDPGRICGTVILVPLINLASFEQKVPHVNPVDGKSMNRFYPGKVDGTQTERALVPHHPPDRGALRSPDRLSRRRPRRGPAALQLLVQRRAARSRTPLPARMVLAFGLERDHHLGRPPEGPAASRYLDAHRGDARQTVDHRRGRPRRHRRPADVTALVGGASSGMRLPEMLPGAPGRWRIPSGSSPSRASRASRACSSIRWSSAGPTSPRACSSATSPISSAGRSSRPAHRRREWSSTSVVCRP